MDFIKKFVNVDGVLTCKHCVNTGKLFFGGWCACEHGQEKKKEQMENLKEAIKSLKNTYPWVWEHGTCAKDPNPDDKLDAVSYALQHPLYKEAHETWAKVQTEQIKKGAEKYPEPLNDEDYTAEELFFHAVQENVDQMHYLQALRVKNRKAEAEKEKMFKDLVKYEHINMDLSKQVEQLKITLDAQITRTKEAEAEADQLKTENFSLVALKELLEGENEELKKWKANMLQQIEKMAKNHLDKKGCKYDR